MGTLHETLFTFMIISRWIFLRIRNVSDRNCRENQNQNLYSLTFSENRAVYEIILNKRGIARQGSRWQYNTNSALSMLGGKNTNTNQNMCYLLYMHCSSGYTNVLISSLHISTLYNTSCRSQWPRRLRRRSAAARLLRSWVWIPPVGMDICLLWVLCVVR
jgi:hypothetical protein